MQRLLLELTDKEIVPTHAGVRAQAILSNGNMLETPALQICINSMYICNAPSPTATTSLKIGEEIVSKVPDVILDRISFSKATF